MVVVASFFLGNHVQLNYCIANIVIYNGEDEILFQDDNNEARWSSDILTAAGFSTVKFLGDTQVFPRTIIISDIWKTFGFGTVVYLAALTSIDSELYDAARVDGAKRLSQVRYITIPMLLPTVTCLH